MLLQVPSVTTIRRPARTRSSSAYGPRPWVVESMWAAISVEPNGSPSREPPRHQPAVRMSSGTSSRPSDVVDTATTATLVPLGRRTCAGASAAGPARRAGVAGAGAGGRVRRADVAAMPWRSSWPRDVQGGVVVRVVTGSSRSLHASPATATTTATSAGATSPSDAVVPVCLPSSRRRPQRAGRPKGVTRTSAASPAEPVSIIRGTRLPSAASSAVCATRSIESVSGLPTA